MTLFRPLSRISLTILVPIVIAIGVVRLLLLPYYIQFEYNRLPPDVYGFTNAERLQYAQHALNYLLNSQGIDYLANEKFADGTPLYNERELSHMLDVKNVVQATLSVWYIAIGLLVILAYFLSRTSATRADLRWGLQSGSLLLASLLIGIMLYIAINFYSFFTDFHKIFFAGDTWIFSFEDTLIRLFPLQFWSDAFTLVGIFALLACAGVWLGAWRWGRVGSGKAK
ncbi:MAG TPA: TIGR01906 family membrane protein [Anaerolineales bacterium]|nr:TIGR01906 family membrane protein [Anaerolineales bacterium]